MANQNKNDEAGEAAASVLTKVVNTLQTIALMPILAFEVILLVVDGDFIITVKRYLKTVGGPKDENPNK